MPQIFIPPLGTVIQLEKDWTFTLFEEHRNQKLIDAAELTPPYRDHNPYLQRSSEWRDKSLAERKAEIDKTNWVYTPHSGLESGNYDYWSGVWEHLFTFREGTELKIDRIYIRQGGQAFDSVTFRSKQWVTAPGDPLFKNRKLKTLRFWAKLHDVNQIHGRMIDE
jgi:hypothetical protein